MAAAQVPELSEREEVAKSVLEKGRQLTEGLERTAAKHGKILNDRAFLDALSLVRRRQNLFEIQKFCQICAEEGIYFHPHHNWFVGNAHDSKSIEKPFASPIGPSANGSWEND